MLAAGIGVGILTIPLVASVSEDAMRAVPTGLREASTAGRPQDDHHGAGRAPGGDLGHRRRLHPGDVPGHRRDDGRRIAAGAASAALLDPLDRALTMTAAMASLATGTDQVRGGATRPFQSLFFVGLLLFLITLVLNLIGDGSCAACGRPTEGPPWH